MRGDANSAARVYCLVCRLETLRDITPAARSSRPAWITPPRTRLARRMAALAGERCNSFPRRDYSAVIPCVGWLIRSQARPGLHRRARPEEFAGDAAGLIKSGVNGLMVTMIPGSEGPTTAGSAHDSSDDTIEVELTDEQQLALSRAAEAARATARPDESSPVLSVPEYENFASRRTARVDFVCNVTFAVAGLGIAVAFLWPASDRHPPAPAPAVTRAAPLAEVAPAGPAEPQGAPVRIKNPFDATEVFEFPHGTTESEAREAVAERLLSRARDRRAEGLALRRASHVQPDRSAAVQQPEVFVTARPREGTLNGTN